MADLVIGGDTPVVPVGGIFDGLINRLMGSVTFDWHKLDPKQLKSAVHALCSGINGFVLGVGNALKPAVSAPLDVDDKAIQKAIDLEVTGLSLLEASAIAEIDRLFPAGGGFAAEGDLTDADVQNYLDLLNANEKADGREAPHYNNVCVERLKANPNALRVLKRLPKTYQLKALGDATFMQKVIDFLFKYGPYLAQILSFMLLFL